MMPDPNQIAQIARQALTAGPTDSRSEDARSRQAQLSFSAMLSAVQSNCRCEACQLLREAVDTMRVRPKQEAPAYGSGDNPPA
jgi:hypothetical protein